jgi:hypothetical protein
VVPWCLWCLLLSEYFKNNGLYGLLRKIGYVSESYKQIKDGHLEIKSGQSGLFNQKRSFYLDTPPSGAMAP